MELQCVSLISLHCFSPVLAGYVASSFTSEPPTYVVIKNEAETSLEFLVARVRPLHLPDLHSTRTITGELKNCTSYLDCAAPDLDQRILLIDLTKVVGRSCLDTVQKNDCPRLKGVIILETREIENKTSRPSDLDLSAAGFPVLSMNFRDASFLSTKLSDIDRAKQFTSILFNDIEGLLTDKESREEMFEVDCDDTCTR